MQDDLLSRLKIDSARDGVRLVTMNGVVLGRLGQDKNTGRWQLDLKAQWHRSPIESLAGDAEHAEMWACDEVAEWMAMERQSYDEQKPWGNSKPPGVD